MFRSRRSESGIEGVSPLNFGTSAFERRQGMTGLLAGMLLIAAMATADPSPSPDAVACGGGSSTGGGFILGMTVGQGVTGQAGSTTLAEDVGFWRWGHLPVLDAGDSHEGGFAEFALY